ncbi:MAG: YfiR family protein [Cyanobacteriota bacterium]
MRKLFLSFLVSFVFTAYAFAENYNPAPVTLETKFFSKIINFSTSISDPKVGIVFEPSSSTSVNSKKRIMQNLSNNGISSVSVPVSSVDQAKNNGINVFYLSKGLSSVDYISRTARRDKILTFSSEPSFVDEGFASVCVGITSNGKSKILINMKNLKKEGNTFSSKLLKLANIIN